MERRRHRRCVELGGLRVDLLEQPDLLRAFADALSGRRPPLRLASANLDHVYRFKDEPDLFEPCADGQWLVLLDGVPLVRAARRRTGRPWGKLAGSDLLPDLLDACEASGARVGILGGMDDSREPMRRALRARWPELDLAGHWTPPRATVEDPERSEELAAEIAATGTDFLIVGLGKPRQEQWIARHAPSTKARVAAAFGASAEFIAGTQQRAPEVFGRLGLEWAYRLAHDPRRLSRRYLLEGPVALARVLAG